MTYTILEVRTVKRRSKKINSNYMSLTPGMMWSVEIAPGQRVMITASEFNMNLIYVGCPDGNVGRQE